MTSLSLAVTMRLIHFFLKRWRARARSSASRPVCFRLVDNTHTLTSEDPGYTSEDVLSISQCGVLEKNGYIDFKLELAEHLGTHLDAPFHFGGPGYLTVDEIPVADLVGPVVVIDVRNNVASNADYELSLADLRSWEAKHVTIPNGAVVMLFTGWQDLWGNPALYINDKDGVKHFPGFSLDAVRWLNETRRIKGIGIDTLSFDHGPATDYPVHQYWLKSGKWALENLCNLDHVPPYGAIAVISPLKHKGGSGGPARVYTFIESTDETACFTEPIRNETLARVH